MGPLPRIPLGAPGLYPYPDIPLRALTRVRMDVCAFAGVTPRGPARLPTGQRTVAVPVESFDEYRQLYGGFEGPGLLPYSVASFFEQGGRRAYILRIVHEYGGAANKAGTAWGAIAGVTSPAGPLRLHARNEGAWGNRLRARLGFTTRPLDVDPSLFSLTRMQLPRGSTVAAGTLLRLNLGSGLREFRFVAQRLDQPLTGLATVTFEAAATAFPQSIDVVEATLALDHPAGIAERFAALGLSAAHPRWLGTVLQEQSALAWPDAAWLASAFTPDDIALPPSVPTTLHDGADRFPDIVTDDFFDAHWTPGDEEPGSGLHAVTQLSDLSLLVVPDLYSPFPLTPPRKLDLPISAAGAEFRCCLPTAPPPTPPEPPPADLVGLRLDPAIPGDLEAITTLQSRVVELAEQMRSWVALLDVPPGLTERRLLRWRARFDSSYAVCYHPWLFTLRRDDGRNVRIALPPSAPAAGLIAAIENASGVPQGPANEIAAQIIDVMDSVPAGLHDELHPLGVNVYLPERDGVRLTAARTLSRDPAYRQLSVRRLMVMLRRALEQQMQWSVFEPNNAFLRGELRQLLRIYLRQLFRASAFRGAMEHEAFFVRCDDSNNPPRLADLGQLLVEIGVAPSEPLEFLILRLARDGDGSLTTSEARG